jgi:hypothetical protein
MWSNNAETCSRFTTCSYISVHNYRAVVGMYIVTCLTAQNLDNFKNARISFAAGIATRYGLDGPGIETRWGWRDSPHPS